MLRCPTLHSSHVQFVTLLDYVGKGSLSGAKEKQAAYQNYNCYADGKGE